MMKSMKIAGTLFLTCIIASTAFADGEYISIDDNGNMVISGPFDAIIPKPEGARVGGPAHSTPSFLNEDLRVSKAGYFADDQFVMVQIETTSAAPGTLTNTNLPVYELAGEEFRARSTCLDISQEELNSDDDPLFEFIEDQNVQIVPAVQAVQLSVVTDDGTGEGLILFMRNVPGGCGAVTAGNEADFHEAFETFVESIQDAN
jgi:hypothetical protein